MLMQVPYTFYVKDTEVMETLKNTVSELGEREAKHLRTWCTRFAYTRMRLHIPSPA